MSKPGKHHNHPDIREDAPGRIPESLIDAAIDGELDPEIQKEIGRALKYDHTRRAQLHETKEAINALRMPVPTPDFTEQVLSRADRHRRFIPRAWRRQVRAGRLCFAGALLAGLLGISALQSQYPRLTTFASQDTPVQDIEHAMENDRAVLAKTVSDEARTLRSSFAPVVDLFDTPPQGPDGRSYELSVTTASYSGSNFSAQDRLAVISRVGMHESRLPSSLATVSFDEAYLQSCKPEQRSPSSALVGFNARHGYTYFSWSVIDTDSLSRLVSRSDEPALPDVPDLP